MQSVDNHLLECLSGLRPLPPVQAALLEAAGCVLAEDVEAPFAIPSFDNSSMDGYAVTMADVQGANDTPVLIPVAGDLPAGTAPDRPLAPGTVVRIMTGAPLPEGTEAVVPVEWTDGGAGKVLISREPRRGANLRRAGDDVHAGELVLRAGTRLTARQVSLLAAVGRERVLVHPRPRVVVLPSGAELVPPGMPLSPGKIHDSNGYGLVAAAVELGAVAEHGGVMGDDAATVTAMLTQAALRADLLITSGGVSAGAYDTIKEVLTASGAATFTKVAMQPGMPQGFGRIGDRLGGTPIFTLPGNPVSALVSFELFVRPALQILAGSTPRWAMTTARALEGWRSPPAKRQYVRAVLEPAEGPGGGTGSGPGVRPVGVQGSHLLADLAEATCLAVVPEEVTEVTPGDLLHCLLLPGRTPSFLLSTTPS